MTRACGAVAVIVSPLEQAISFVADYFIGPPCVSPIHVSSFSRHILDEREFVGKGDATNDFCCGEDVESMEVLIYEPAELQLLSLGAPVEIVAFAMILIQGMSTSSPLAFRCALMIVCCKPSRSHAIHRCPLCVCWLVYPG